MKRTRFTNWFLVALFWMICPVGQGTVLSAQMGVLVPAQWAVAPLPTNPQAKQKYDEGHAALKSNDFASAIAAFRRLVELEPDYLPGHQDLMEAVRSAEKEKEKKREDEQKAPPAVVSTPKSEGSNTRMTPAIEPSVPIGGATTNALPLMAMKTRATADKILRQMYEKWAAKYPQEAAFQWALGTLWWSDKAKAKQFYLQAVRLNPKLVVAYKGLAQIADQTHDVDARRTYLKKVTELSPDDANSLFDLALTYRYVDESTFIKLTDDLLRRFPKDAAGIRALTCRADDVENPADRLALLEKIKRDFPGNGFANAAMMELFRLYAEKSGTEALAFAREMAKSMPEVKTWKDVVAFQEALVHATTLISEKNYLEAGAVLDKLKIPGGLSGTEIDLLRAEATAGAGNSQKAYEQVLALVAKEPHNTLFEALQRFGMTLKKSRREVESDVARFRIEHARVLKDFKLVNFADGKDVKLSDYRGRVVFVNFWFPT